MFLKKWYEKRNIIPQNILEVLFNHAFFLLKKL